MSALRLCVFVLSDLITCRDKAVSVLATHFKNGFLLSEKILKLSPTFFVYSFFTSPASRLEMTLLRAPKQEKHAVVWRKGEERDERKEEKSKGSLRKERERAKNVVADELFITSLIVSRER